MKLILIAVMAFTLSQQSFGSELENLKSQIFELAESFKGELDRDKKLQAQLDPLVSELESLVGEMSTDQKAKRIVGRWKQVFGPYTYGPIPAISPRLDPEAIYQIIYSEGFYYNVGISKALGIKYTTLLKGEYTVEEDRIAIEFVENSLVNRKVDLPLPDMPDAALAGDLKRYIFPKFLPPVGSKGALFEIYADEDIRIAYGTNGRDLEDRDIYILERVE